MTRFALLLPLLLAACQASPPPAASPTSEQFTYRKITSQGSRVECAFTVGNDGIERTLSSTTWRGRTVMNVRARYDSSHHLVNAEVTLRAGGAGSRVLVRVAEGKATVRREGQEGQTFDVPAGVVVTSAPDWTDTFSLCRLYDSLEGGRQEFPGLWVHPTKAAFRLSLAAEKTGESVIEHEGGTLELTRLTLTLRNNSRYAAWTDPHGLMVKLVSLPFKPGGFQMALEGFEGSTAALKPE